MRNAYFAFLALGIAFIVIGISGSGQKTFLYIGIVFMVLGALGFRRSRS